ncbi:hypothetical protein [uncultured Cytophaga sp.]|uniref:hypothetical protein n=1 Tax=uncultured Cytophaga sp. TaxID=160238 RepID=UPI002632DCA7|nr:hypothetical protein [uncultured Cytophaga sp.]
MKSKFLMFILLSFLSKSIRAQTYFALTPVLGIGTSFSKIKSDDSFSAKNNFASVFTRYGFLLNFHKNKIGLSSGITLSRSLNVNFSYKHNIFSNSIYVFAVPILLSYDSKEFNLFYIKNNRPYMEDEEENVKSNFFLMSFKLRPFAGINIDFVDRMSEDTVINKGYDYTETLQYSILNNNGLSSIFGFTVQFLQKGKERLALNFYFNQGLTKYLSANYTYTENNNTQTTSVVSKGSYISIGLSYPINIWDLEKRKVIKGKF